MRSSSFATAASRQIGRDGEVAIPPGAEVIDVAGKTVLPGFIDGHAHLEDFHGELYLHLGITSCVTIEIFQDGPWTLAQKRGTESGKIKGPRIWTSGQAIGGVRTETDAPDSRAVRGNITVETPEEARKAMRDKKEQGYDLIKLNEFISYDLVHAACDEAHKLGLPVTAHSWDVIESVKAGVDSIEHIWSVGYSSILDVKRRRQLAKQRLAGNIEQELAGSYYEPENFDDIIERDGGAWRRLDADHRQMAAAAVAERGALSRTRAANSRRSGRRSAGRRAHHRRRRLRQDRTSATRRSSSTAPRSSTRRPTSSSAASSPPAAFSRKAPIRRAAWRRCCCTRRW